MNREIKFRAKEIGSNKWVYGYYCKDYANVSYITTLVGVSTSTIYEDTLCQFTGLKDKNGKEIYEGDLIGSLGFGNFRVEFFDGMFCAFKIIEESNQENAYRIDWLIKTYDLEVIGNIHENPELI